MVKKQMMLLGLCMVLCLGGCGNPDGNSVSNESTATEKDTHRTQNDVVREAAEPETDEEDIISENESWQENVYSNTVLEDEDFIYICGLSSIQKIDKKSNACEVIWEKEENKLYGIDSELKEGLGILLNDKIYFLERTLDTTWGGVILEHHFSVVNTDGSGYKQIESVSGENGDCLFVRDGVLYFDATKGKGYEVNASGDLLTDKPVTVKMDDVFEGYVPEGYYANGYRDLSQMESVIRYGHYFLRDEEYNFCIMDPETGKRKDFMEEASSIGLDALADDMFVVSASMEDNQGKYTLYLVDNTTLEEKALLSYESGNYPDIITMDEESLYLLWSEEQEQRITYCYERVSLATGERTKLFTQEEYITFAGAPQYIMNISVSNDFIYYPGEQDYKLFVMRRNVKSPEKQEIVGDAFRDTGISEVGSVKTYEENFYSPNNPENVTATVDLKWLVVDERFPGAEAINKVLEESQQGYIAYEEKMAKEAAEWVDEYDGIAYSFTSNPSSIHYFDGNYVSFYEQNYDYMGGAHGMPYRIGYTFDLQTGKQLYLRDVIADDENSLKEIVSRYFTEMYEENPDIYWEDAIDTVYEYTNLESFFYLTQEGIVFWYEPYTLAPFGAGTQEVCIPYSEFALNISLGY